MQLVNYVKIITGIFIFYSCSQESSDTNNQPETEGIGPDNAIAGKILCGYQGWFNAPGDGADLEWKHYQKNGKFEPGSCTIDYWPDMEEYSEEASYQTSFVHEDGSPAYVFSSADPGTVDLHFQWMQEYGIDGVFVQRFIHGTRNEKLKANYHKVFDNCYLASEKHDRIVSVMYDLSGSPQDFIVEHTKKDWRTLVDRYNLTDPGKSNLLTHRGKPVVAIWGAGFKDRDYTLPEIKELIDFFKNDPEYGGCSVLLGVPTGWRELNRDCIDDPMMHELIRMADIVHPWTPGRYRNLEEVNQHRTQYTEPDKAWCDENGLTYMPVVFPGFSWYNLKGGEDDFNRIPRLKGDFLWRQFYNAVSADVETIYVAMFDEIDEGTAIFKVTNNPPVGESPFLTYEGLPSDYYLRLTGEATRMLRKEVPLSENSPLYPE